MKITCDSCGAKYTVSDDKVQGKTVKVKCRKCSAVIVVSATGAVQTTGGAAGPEVSFTVSVSDTDQRTMTMGQIVEAYNEGSIDAETFVWTEGMGDWQPLKDVDQIVDALHDAAQHAEPQQEQDDEEELGRTVAMADAGAKLEAHLAAGGGAANFGSAMTAPAFGGGGGGGHDLSSTVAMAEGSYAPTYGQQPAPVAARKMAPTPQPAAFGAHSSGVAAGGGLFGTAAGMGPSGGAAAMYGGGAPVGNMFSGGSGPAPGGGGKDENSAIFSLNMLTAKAGNAPTAPATSAKSSEDSGLIDLRALASGAGPADGGGGVMAQMAAAPAGDLFPLGAPPPVQAMASMTPQAEQRSGGAGKGLIIFLAAAVVALAGGLVFVIVRGPSSADAKAGEGSSPSAVVAPTAAPETEKTAEPVASTAPSAETSPSADPSAAASGSKPLIAQNPRTPRTPPPPGTPRDPGQTTKAPPPPAKTSTGGGGCACKPEDLMCNMRCAQKKK